MVSTSNYHYRKRLIASSVQGLGGPSRRYVARKSPEKNIEGFGFGVFGV